MELRKREKTKPTMVLLHGWNWKNYSKFCESYNPWENRSIFVSELRKHFDVFVVTFPGFCEVDEPSDAWWGLDNFAKYVQDCLKERGIVPSIVLGYSFGGAVAVRLKRSFGLKCPVILVSPAIVRAETRKNIQGVFLRTIVPAFVMDWLRDFYLCRIVKNPYYKYGTKFLQNTYQKIVRLDLSHELLEIPTKELVCIFGSEDNATPPNYLLEKLGKTNHSKSVKIIQGGGHDIANTHTSKIIDLINDFVSTRGD